MKEWMEELKAFVATARELGPAGLYREVRHFPGYGWRILRQTYRLFMDNRGPYQANALAYRSMLSMVPMIVFVISLSAWIFGSEVDQQTKRLKEIAKKYIVFESHDVDLPINLPKMGNGPGGTGPVNGGTADPGGAGPGNGAPGNGEGPADGSTASGASDGAGPADGSTAGSVQKEPADIVDDIWIYVDRFKDEAERGTQGGFLILLVTSIILINGIEVIFNNLWHVRRRRPWAGRLLAYTSMTVLIPLLFGISFYMTAMVQFETIESALNENVVLKHIPLIRLTWGLFKDLGLPLATIWILFLAMYKWLPNTKVETISAFIGSFFSATAFEIAKWGFSFFTAKMVEARLLWWGPIGVFIVFLVWIYLIWYIVLFGAQLTYVIQNYRYVLRNGSDLRGRFGDAYIACRIMLEIGIAHNRGEKVPTVRQIAELLMVDVPRIQKILGYLSDANLLILGTAPGRHGDEDEVYVPGRDLGKISVAQVIGVVGDVWRLPGRGGKKSEIAGNGESEPAAPPTDGGAGESGGAAAGEAPSLSRDPEAELASLLAESRDSIEELLSLSFRELIEKGESADPAGG